MTPGPVNPLRQAVAEKLAAAAGIDIYDALDRVELADGNVVVSLAGLRKNINFDANAAVREHLVRCGGRSGKSLLSLIRAIESPPEVLLIMQPDGVKPEGYDSIDLNQDELGSCRPYGSASAMGTLLLASGVELPRGPKPKLPNTCPRCNADTGPGRPNRHCKDCRSQGFSS